MDCWQFLKSLDLFGTTVQLNFRRQGSSINTYCGGLISAIIGAFLVFYLAVRVDQVVNKKHDVFDFSTFETDFEELGRVEMEEFGMMLILNKYRLDTIRRTTIDLEQQERAMTFSATNLINEASVHETSFRICTREDFEKYDLAEYYDSLQEDTPDSMMCIDDWGDSFLMGNPTRAESAAVFRAFATKTDDADLYPGEFDDYFWEMTAVQRQVDWSIYNGYPVKSHLKDLGYFTLDGESTQLKVIDIRPNTIIAKDSLWQLDIREPEQEFFDIGETRDMHFSPAMARDGETYLFLTELRLGRTAQEHKRTVYGFMELFENFGGIKEALLLIGAILMGSAAEFKLLGLYATELFRVKSNQTTGRKNRRKASRVSISTCEAMNIWWQRSMETISCGACTFKENAKKTFIDRSEELIEKQLDIVTMIKLMRRFKALFKRDDLFDAEAKDAAYNNCLEVLDLDRPAEEMVDTDSSQDRDRVYTVTEGNTFSSLQRRSTIQPQKSKRRLDSETGTPMNQELVSESSSALKPLTSSIAGDLHLTSLKKVRESDFRPNDIEMASLDESSQETPEPVETKLQQPTNVKRRATIAAKPDSTPYFSGKNTDEEGPPIKRRSTVREPKAFQGAAPPDEDPEANLGGHQAVRAKLRKQRRASKVREQSN